ncbi:stage III sporulation protein SpoIIIAB [Metabacillus sp. RGM 3146]|uniref:stage III sporulation protein SpoIIIAB n=1 Tax=Metabacillus sp. RGM 3146 TaxID=3401092 RepID=UPI003B98F842
MIKLIGAVLIIAASTFTGFEFARRFSDRTKLLRQLKSALQSLEAEIMFSHKPLAAAAYDIGKQIPKPLSLFFEKFSERLSKGHTSVKAAWDSSLDDLASFSSIKKGELQVLKQFGETLGKHDLISQQKHIRLALTHLEREESDAEDRQARYEKMIKSLGFLSGLLIVILLM